MIEAGVEDPVIRKGLKALDPSRVLPFRFIQAAKYAPQYEPELETAMLKCLGVQEQLTGKTVILLDVSGSMSDPISGKSKMQCFDAMNGLGILVREICENVRIYSFSADCVEVPARRGFALRDAVMKSQIHSSTYLGKAVDKAFKENKDTDRLIVLTDEQSHDKLPYIIDKQFQGYIINVGSCQNGIGYGQYTKIDGWSEAIITYIREYEKMIYGKC
jgi:hypothetical protein